MSQLLMLEQKAVGYNVVQIPELGFSTRNTFASISQCEDLNDCSNNCSINKIESLSVLKESKETNIGS
ncbi:hypothetical protein J6590_086707, partial [Homalodisca vitripennis]